MGATMTSGAFHDALDLLKNESLHRLGDAAYAAKRTRHGRRITWVNNRHINPTNLCIHRCRFCDFAARATDAHAYTLDEDTILALVAEPALREVHIVGGLWKTWGFERSIRLVERIRELRPDLWIKAFTAVEVDFFAYTTRSAHLEVLKRLQASGVNMLPGGGAEVLSARVHHELYPDKLSPEGWLKIHRLAHSIGLQSNATLLFGHIETDEEIVEHLFLLRELQEATGGFTSFIPLAYQPGNTQLVPRLVSPVRCLRVIALSRLVLDNIPHIKAYWPSLQLETATAALSFGADDLDGTLGEERIMQLAGTTSPARSHKSLLERLIRDAGQIPVERDGAGNLVSPPAMAMEQ